MTDALDMPRLSKPHQSLINGRARTQPREQCGDKWLACGLRGDTFPDGLGCAHAGLTLYVIYSNQKSKKISSIPLWITSAIGEEGQFVTDPIKNLWQSASITVAVDEMCVVTDERCGEFGRAISKTNFLATMHAWMNRFLL
ncbi:MAG: hypothetical protein LBP52_04000 [Burkholderiaceae bacterium]|jgi:hypothetical protein|nr:hypothetical protein [Burkholderiaceae bacterium]